MRRLRLGLVAVALAACARQPITGRPVPGGDAAVRWSPRPVAVPLVACGDGTYAGRVTLRAAEFPVTVDPGAADGVPRIVVPDVGDGTRGAIDGVRRDGGFDVDGLLRLHPGAAQVEVSLGATCEGASPPELTFFVTERPLLDVDLGGRTFRAMLLDRDADGRFDDLDATRVVFDRDGDGEHDDDAEGYGADEAFDLGTGAFRVREIAADGTAVAFEPSWRWPSVRPFVGKGDLAPPLPAEALDGGAPIDLGPLRGRRVLLLFWFPT